MLQFDQLQDVVGRWSQDNFGAQTTPYFNIHIEPFPVDWKINHPMPPALVALDGLAPLLGLVEELGELFDGPTQRDRYDAVGDIVIYMCDYASREGFEIPLGRNAGDKENTEDHFDVDPPSKDVLVIWIGRLYHCVLKRYQGIRGFNDDAKFQAERLLCVRCFLACLARYARHEFNDSLLVIANRTWNDIVSKRDWKNSPTNAEGIQHDGN